MRPSTTKTSCTPTTCYGRVKQKQHSPISNEAHEKIKDDSARVSYRFCEIVCTKRDIARLIAQSGARRSIAVLRQRPRPHYAYTYACVAAHASKRNENETETSRHTSHTPVCMYAIAFPVISVRGKEHRAKNNPNGFNCGGCRETPVRNSTRISI